MGLIQSTSGVASAAFTAALPAPSQASSRVVLIVAGNTTVPTPNGWTLRTSQVNFMGHYLWDRAGGGQSYPVAPNAGQVTWWIGEVSQGVYSDAKSQNNAGEEDNTYSTPSVTGAGLTVASIASTTGKATARTVSGWTNGYTEVADLCNPTADYPMQGVATSPATGTTSTAATYSAMSVGRSAIIATYTTSTGSAPNKGAASGGWKIAGHTAGRVALSGAAAGAVAWAGVAAGVTTHRGATEGSWSVTVAAAGTAPAVGQHTGGAAGGWTVSGSASGQAPAVGERSGDVSGSWAVTGVATGAAAHSGAATASWAVHGSTVGTTRHQGASTDGWTFVGTATGQAPEPGKASGVAAGAWRFTGAAEGTTDHNGTSAGGWLWSGLATGTTVRTGTATGRWTVTGTATGGNHTYHPAVQPSSTLTVPGASTTTITPDLSCSVTAPNLHMEVTVGILTTGDYGYPITGQLLDGTQPKDVTGATGELHLRRSDGTVLTAGVTWTDPAQGQWSYTLTEGDLTDAGTYSLEVQVESAGVVQTFPGGSVQVRAEYA